MSKSDHKTTPKQGANDHAEGGALVAAQDAVHQAADGIAANPALALLGGLAIGAIVGALVPRSAKEAELLAPVGARVGGAARAAYDAARTAGGDALDEAGISQDKLRQQASKLFGEVLGAAGTAGKAAFVAARDAGTGPDAR